MVRRLTVQAGNVSGIREGARELLPGPLHDAKVYPLLLPRLGGRDIRQPPFKLDLDATLLRSGTRVTSACDDCKALRDARPDVLQLVAQRPRGIGVMPLSIQDGLARHTKQALEGIMRLGDAGSRVVQDEARHERAAVVGAHLPARHVPCSRSLRRRTRTGGERFVHGAKNMLRIRAFKE